ncbi:hypothetical protein Cgig2_016399 [Carnegiea gigantea]|uniref:PLAC8 motif-containing protein n=1 Tax=Carnegiea gigantea TaxID=171969 RepID=A0A9Q1K8B4_9CARY|nr:hypothetical protein Cgig2_016399 [Carnegiea gigantea]
MLFNDVHRDNVVQSSVGVVMDNFENIQAYHAPTILVNVDQHHPNRDFVYGDQEGRSDTSKQFSLLWELLLVTLPTWTNFNPGESLTKDCIVSESSAKDVEESGVDCEIPNGYKTKTHVSLQVSASRKGLLTDEISPKDFPGIVGGFTRKFKLQRLRARGMLNRVLPKKSQRDLWWKPKDIAHLRKIYCKNGTHKPKERVHMMVVVVLLHLNCFAQYALCALNLEYKRSNRPIIGVGVCLSVAIIAPAVAGLYCMLSPLGKDYECDADEEAPAQLRRKSLGAEEEVGIVESTPEWRGSLFHLSEDFRVAYMSIFCCFCVFGWNMERLGFGSMYVHIATFLLLCVAPFWIFNLAAVNIDSDALREILGITGVVLCLFGLLYGGFWRIQIRKRFKLPPNHFCFGKPDFTDCIQWLLCCWCSLAQEVRTGDFYNIVENKLHRKQMGEVDDDGHTPLTPLPREGVTDPGSSAWMNSSLTNIRRSTQKNEIMEPPAPSTMKMVGWES